MKRVLAAMLCMSMLMVGSTTAYAQDIGSFGDGGFGDSATATMTYDVDSTYIVSIPATINMNQENKLTASMMDIRSNEIVEVYTDSKVQMENKNNSAAGKTAKSILISCGARLALFDIKELRDLTAYDELELDTLGEEKRKIL